MNKKKFPSAIIGIGLIIALGAYGHIRGKITENELNASHKFTVGYVTKHSYLNKAGQAIDYVFQFKNKEYKSGELGSRLRHTLHKKYIVKFNPNEPKNSKMLLDKEVKRDAIPPVEGWTKIPKGILKK